MEKYDLVKYNNYEWYIIDIDSDKVTLLLNDILPKGEIEELFDESLLDSFKDVRFSYNPKNWRWSDSPIRQALNTKWLSKFNRAELVQMETKIEFNNEIMIANDFVKLMTYEEIQNIPVEILKSSRYGYWLASPSFVNWHGSLVCIVGASGAATYSYVNFSLGVRPVVSVKLVTGTVTPLKPEQNECEPSHEYNICHELAGNSGKYHDYLYYQNGKYKLSVPQKLLFDEIEKIKSKIDKLEE